MDEDEKHGCGTVVLMVFVGLSIGCFFVGVRELTGMPKL